jgi:phosphoserine phosphatase
VSPAEGWPGAEILFFDCDSTLAAMEGIDELAARCGADVSALTRAAMAGEIALDQVFRMRLERISARPADLDWVAGRYMATQVEDAAAVLDALRSLGITCHVLSGGLLPAVLPFAESLGFATDQVHAVPYPLVSESPAAALDIACAHPLARDGGKPLVIAATCARLGIDPHRALLVGDGASDLEAAADIGLFVGFGGVVTRDRVREEAAVFLPGPGLCGLLPLAAGPDRTAELQRTRPELLAAARRQLPATP